MLRIKILLESLILDKINDRWASIKLRRFVYQNTADEDVLWEKRFVVVAVVVV